jgi:hypothetical protein
MLISNSTNLIPFIYNGTISIIAKSTNITSLIKIASNDTSSQYTRGPYKKAIVVLGTKALFEPSVLIQYDMNLCTTIISVHGPLRMRYWAVLMMTIESELIPNRRKIQVGVSVELLKA